jgi:hypothetical protein
MTMRVVISGATGFIGRELCRRLRGEYEVIALSRDARKAGDVLGADVEVVEWDAKTAGGWTTRVDGAHAVVNLAGENVAAGRWSAAKKNKILQSRTNCTTAMVDAVNAARQKPTIVVQASAVGYYGSRGDETLDEETESGTGFLASVCRNVESLAGRVTTSGVRLAIVRTGIVLGSGDGALPKLMLPFRFYLGGHVGSGRQWVSWISVVDEVRALRFLIAQPDARGAFNFTAPEPVRMKRFCKVLGESLGKPAWTAVPAFLLRVAAGEMADEMLLASQRALPRRLLEAGFEFRHRHVGDAMADIVQGEHTQ